MRQRRDIAIADISASNDHIANIHAVAGCITEPTRTNGCFEFDTWRISKP